MLNFSSGTRAIRSFTIPEPKWLKWCDRFSDQKRNEWRGGKKGIRCLYTSHKSNVSQWPSLPLIYSCIANTKTQARAAYAIWPCGELLWCDVITPHCHKWTTSLPRPPVNKFPKGGGGARSHVPLYCALDGHEIIAMRRAARFPF